MKKLRKFAMLAMIPVLAVSVLSAKFILPSKYAYAALDYAANSYVVGGGLNIAGDGVKSGAWQSEYDLNDRIRPDVIAGAILSLKYPSGDEVAAEAGNPGVYKLDVAGYYTAVYNKGGKPVTRVFKFFVNAESYQIELPYNGAEIPTLIAKGGEVNLPKASVIYTDKKGEVVTDKAESDKIEVSVTSVDGSETFSQNNAAKMKFNAPANGGKIFISYFYGEDSRAVIQKDYTVTVTDSSNINDRLVPTLNVGSVGDNIPLMTKVTLPVASATHDEDKNVKIEVSISFNGSPCNVYTVKENMLDRYMLDENATSVFIADEYKDKDGAFKDQYYARDTAANNDKDQGGNIVKFDNKRDMTFYPDKAGSYEIKYTATPDAGQPAVTTFKMTVSDTGEMGKPYIKVKPGDIPTVWTNNKIIKLDGNTDKEKTYDIKDSEELRLYFPKPSFADNAGLEKDIFAVNGKVRVELLKGNATVERLTFEDGAYVSSLAAADRKIKELVPADSRFGDEVFYIPASKLDTASDYEIKYYVDDVAASVNSVQKSFTVQIKSELKDVSRPEITFTDISKTVKIGGKLTQPVKNANVGVSDESNAVTQEIRYALSSRAAADIEKDVKTDFKDGIDTNAGDYEFTDKLDEIFYKGVMEKFTLAAIDPAAQAGDYNKIIVYVYAKDAVGNERRDYKLIDIIDTAVAENAPTIESVKMHGAEIVSTELKAKNGRNYEIGPNNYVVIDSITVKQANAKDTYMGYEFSISKDGEAISSYITVTSWIDTLGICTPGVTYDYNNPAYVDPNTYLNIENFKFLPEGEGDYTITLSVFNVSGATRSISFTLTVEPREDIGGTSNAANIVMEVPKELEYGRTVELPDRVAFYKSGPRAGQLVDMTQQANKEYFYKTTLRGPQYSFQGRELTALMTGRYDYVIFCESVTNNYNDSISGDTTITDTVGPTVRLTGAIPTVSIDAAKDIFLPGMMSSDAAGVDTDDLNESVQVTNGGKSEYAKPVTQSVYNDFVAKDPSLAGKISVGMYYFTPFADSSSSNKIDGKYTVTYSVKDKNGIQSAALGFTIEVGDVFVPVIKLTGSAKYAERIKKGEKLTFNLNFDATDDLYEKESNGTFKFVSGSTIAKSEVKITLTAPDGSAKGEFTNWTSTKKSETYVLDQAGEYTVTYTVTDKAGNEGTLTYKITVYEKTTKPIINEKVLAVILIVAGVLLIAGVAFYFVRFRRKAQ